MAWRLLCPALMLKNTGQRWTKLCLSQRCAISIMVLFQIALQGSRLRFNTVLTISQ